jgi:hypothetical protein
VAFLLMGSRAHACLPCVFVAMSSSCLYVLCVCALVRQQERRRAELGAVLLQRAAKELMPGELELLVMMYGLNGERPMKRTVSFENTIRHYRCLACGTLG